MRNINTNWMFDKTIDKTKADFLKRPSSCLFSTRRTTLATQKRVAAL